MRLLTDTNVLLWFLSDSERLPAGHKEAIANPENQIYVSIVSLWEIVIKMNIGKLEIGADFETFFNLVTKDCGFRILQISAAHLCQYLKLPLLHRDPFDRLIWSQAKAERMAFLYTDEIFNDYNSL